ncbi:MAG TPA: DUF4422 domain-containing protein [Candidatus Enterosoma merdigallinarum]|nr:DUF4422 domain-containing protein [Candidatus Enterosoma merdigallinarum]
MKNKSIQLFVCAHKEVDRFTSDPNFKFVGVGTKKHEIVCDCTDDTGINIAEKNESYCELTLLYWIWKNIKTVDYVGLMHYRRFFYHPLPYLLKRQFVPYSSEELLASLKDEKTILLPKKFKVNHFYFLKSIFHKLPFKTYKDVFISINFPKDLEKTRQTIQALYPNYVDSFDKVLNSKSIHYGNVMVCSTKIFDEYCTFLFTILEQLEKEIDISNYIGNQRRLFGYVGEVLVDTFFQKHKEIKIKELPLCNNEANFHWNLRNLI